MPGYSTAAKALMLNALRGAGGITHVSLHTADPGDTGANELSGGSPAYARQPVSYGAPASGQIDDTTNGATFNVPAGTTVAYIGRWSAASAGTFLGSNQIKDPGGNPAPETYAQQGTYTVTDDKLDLNK